MNEEEKAIDYIGNTTYKFLEHPFCNINKVEMNLYDFKQIEILLNLIEKQKKEIENIKKEVQEHIAFENRLKRDGTEPDLFNQGRFYVANNIKDILDGREII